MALPSCSLKAILLRVHVAAISSNNVCIVQGANPELCCHHPLHWVVLSHTSGPVDCLRNHGLPKFVPNACFSQSTELLSPGEILQTWVAGRMTEAVFIWQQGPAGQSEWCRSAKGKHYFFLRKDMWYSCRHSKERSGWVSEAGWNICFVFPRLLTAKQSYFGVFTSLAVILNIVFAKFSTFC